MVRETSHEIKDLNKFEESFSAIPVVGQGMVRVIVMMMDVLVCQAHQPGQVHPNR